MGYASLFEVRCLNSAGTAAWTYDTEVSKAAGTYHQFSFTITRPINPIGTVSFAFDAFTSGALGNSLYQFKRNSTVESSGQLTAGYLTYPWSKTYTDLKQGDVFVIYVAESAGGGGFSWMRNRKMYIFESVFLIEDKGS